MVQTVVKEVGRRIRQLRTARTGPAPDPGRAERARPDQRRAIWWLSRPDR
jgi:hypothetical protein